jgi:hypothetical protein
MPRHRVTACSGNARGMERQLPDEGSKKVPAPCAQRLPARARHAARRRHHGLIRVGAGDRNSKHDFSAGLAESKLPASPLGVPGDWLVALGTAMGVVFTPRRSTCTRDPGWPQTCHRPRRHCRALAPGPLTPSRTPSPWRSLLMAIGSTLNLPLNPINPGTNARKNPNPSPYTFTNRCVLPRLEDTWHTGPWSLSSRGSFERLGRHRLSRRATAPG